MSPPIHLTHCRVDLIRRVAEHDDAVVRLTTREAALLSYLIAHPNRTVSRDEIHAEVWGYGPTIITRAADDTLRRLRPKLGEDPKEPIHIFTVHGEGYRYVPLASETAPDLDAPTQGIPRPRTTFFGRAAELVALMEAVEGGVVLTTLLGPGGVGKTRLALECGQRLGPERRNAWFIDLSDANTAMELIDEMVRVLGIDLGAVSDADVAATRIGEALATVVTPLLILDNLEQIRDTSARVIDRLLAVAPGVQIIATSRFRLELDGERVIALGSINTEQGAQLFEDRARALAFDFRTRPEEHAMVVALVEQLDGLPLAIELAAARTSTMSIPELSEALGQGTDALRGRTQGRPDRHQTLEHTLQWTWDLLDPWARSALAQCAVFRHGFALWAAEAVIDLSAFPDAPPTDQVIETLVDCSLIHTVHSPEQIYQIRFSLYETVRHFARVQLEKDGQVAEVQGRMRSALLGWVEPAGDAYVDIRGDEIRRRVSVEFETLIAIARHAPNNDERARALVAVGSVVGSGHFQMVTAWEIIERIEFEALEPDVRFTAQLQAGRYAMILGRPDVALEYIEVALAGARKQGHGRTEIQALEARAIVRTERSEGAEADADRDAAHQLARQRGDPTHVGFQLIQQGSSLQQRGENQAAYDTLREAVQLLAGTGMDCALAYVDVYMGQISRNEGRLTEASAHASRALKVGQDTNDLQLQMMAWSTLGSIARWRGSDCAEEAAGLYSCAHDIAKRTFHIRAETYTATGLARALQALGQTQEAMQLTQQTLDKSIAGGLIHSEVKCRFQLAEFAADNGCWSEAESLCHEALGPARAHGSASSEADVLQVLAQVLYETDRMDAAAEQAAEAVRIVQEDDVPHFASWPLIIGALVALRSGDQAGTQALLDEAVAVTRMKQDQYSRCVAFAFRAIGLSFTDAVQQARTDLESIRDIRDCVDTAQLTVLSDVAQAFVDRASGDVDGAERRIAAATQVSLGAAGDVVNPAPGGRYPVVRIALQLFKWSDKA